MSARALLSLDELLSSLSTALEGPSPAAPDPRDRNTLEADLVWCRVERGELGEAFRLLWEAESTPDLGPARQLMRAELQAYCGNEDAALALIAELEGDNAASAMVRARVARSRGDWELTSRHAFGGDPRSERRSARTAARRPRQHRTRET